MSSYDRLNNIKINNFSEELVIMNIIRFMLHSIRPFKWYLIGPFTVVIYHSISISLRPYLLKILVDTATLESTAYTVNSLWYVAAFFCLVQFLSPCLWAFYDWCALQYEPRMKNYIADTLMDRVTQHDYTFFQNNFAGNLSAKLSDVARTIPDIWNIFLFNFLGSFLSICLAMYTLWTIHTYFALAIAVWALVMIFVMIVRLSQFDFLTQRVAEANARMVGCIVDIITNMLAVRLFARRKFEVENLKPAQQEYLQASLKRRYFLLKFWFFQGQGFVVYQVLVLYLLITLHFDGKITPGDFGMILTVNLLIVEDLTKLADQLRYFSEYWGTVGQALKTIYLPLGQTDKPNAKPLIVSAGEIKFDQVRFFYKGAEPLFYNKSVTIEAGQKVGLVGYSGSGKTTFVNLILRLFDLSSGTILIDNQSIKDVTQASLRQAIAMIPQEPSLFHRTIMENIRYGRLEATDQEVIEAAKKANAHLFIMGLPEKYQTLVGERGLKLSGGQRQRISIARAILKNAPILVLDEATSQLDTITEHEIQIALTDFMKDKTTVVVAHRLSTLLSMDRILVFDKGKIVQDGSHNDLVVQNGLYRTLWGAQVCGFLPNT